MHADGLNRPTTGTNAARVLVVDDEHHVRDLLSRWLGDDGWDCTLAENAEEALMLLKSTPIQIVVSDINMPGCSGMWLLQRVTEEFPDTSVLMLTASCDTRLAIEALTCGACGYLLKPIQREEFNFHLREARERRELILERREHLQNLERRVQEQTFAIRLAHEETIYRLVTAAACRDHETGAHIRRTGLFSEVLAIAAGWSKPDAEHLRLAAPMHDIGKIGIPDAVLQKPGKLTSQEYERMKEHTTIGARMLAGSASPVLQLAEKIALCHHERWDGSGYPQGLSGERIPEAARILSIVDVYDALSHDRIYRRAMDEDAVLAMMQRGQGTQFDPGLLTLFFTVFEKIRAIADLNPDAVQSADTDYRMPVVDQLSVTEITCSQ